MGDSNMNLEEMPGSAFLDLKSRYALDNRYSRHQANFSDLSRAPSFSQLFSG
jgi:hypothetical protein